MNSLSVQNAAPIPNKRFSARYAIVDSIDQKWLFSIDRFGLVAVIRRFYSDDQFIALSGHSDSEFDVFRLALMR